MMTMTKTHGQRKKSIKIMFEPYSSNNDYHIMIKSEYRPMGNDAGDDGNDSGKVLDFPVRQNTIPKQ